MHKVAIIGAGLAGLTAARLLARTGAEVTMIDKGQVVGGRLATRRIGDAVFDHGAQFFTVRSDEFRGFVNELIAADLVTEWCHGFAEVDGYPRYVCRDGMNTMADWLVAATPGSMLGHTTATAIRRSDTHWLVEHDRGSLEADSVILTAPVPQSVALLEAGGLVVPPEHSTPLAETRYHSAMALLVVLDRPSSVPAPGGVQQPDHPHFSFIGDNQAKGISTVPAVTFHTSRSLTAELWDQPTADIITTLLDLARPWLGDARIDDAQLERWRYTGPIDPWTERTVTVFDHPGALALAGDAFGGSKVEGAFLSGHAAAQALLASR